MKRTCRISSFWWNEWITQLKFQDQDKEISNTERQISWQVREIKSGYILWLQAYLRMIRQNGRFISIFPLQLHHETFTSFLRYSVKITYTHRVFKKKRFLRDGFSLNFFSNFNVIPWEKFWWCLKITDMIHILQKLF